MQCVICEKEVQVEATEMVAGRMITPTEFLPQHEKEYACGGCSLENLNKKIDEVKDERDAFEEEIVSLDTKVDRLNDKNCDIEEKIESLKERIEELDNHIIELEKEIE